MEDVRRQRNPLNEASQQAARHARTSAVGGHMHTQRHRKVPRHDPTRMGLHDTASWPGRDRDKTTHPSRAGGRSKPVTPSIHRNIRQIDR
jgi:hypothetical protein